MKKHLLLIFTLFLFSITTFAQLITPFTVRYSVSQKGGIVILANTASGCGTGTTSCGGNTCAVAHAETAPAGTAVDNDFVNTYVDIDGSASTFMSSSDSLNLAVCSQISFAGLYWGAGGSTGDPDGAHWATRGTVKLKVNNGAYQTLTADVAYDNAVGFKSYHNFKDITSIVAATGRTGRYTVADMPLLNDNGTTKNRWGGWAIVVVYKNDLDNFRNLVVFNGLTNVSSSNPSTDLTVSGFVTPPTGPVTLGVGFVTYDGDRGFAASGSCSTTYKGDSLLFNGAGTFKIISDAIHPANDAFNSTISNNGVLTPFRNPSYNNTLGHDANIFVPDNVTKTYIGNSAISATIRQKTGGETYLTQVVTSAIDVYEPDLRGGLRVTDLNGGIVNPGDTLEYTMVVRNIGSNPSINTYVVDTLEANAVYVPNSLKITFGPNIGPKTDVSGDDQGEYFPIARSIKVRVGTGANAVIGGLVLNSPTGLDSTQIKFRTTATTDCIVLICDNNINNRFRVIATGQLSGNTFDHGSNPEIFDGLGCPVEGFTTTHIIAGACPAPTATSNSPVCTGDTISLSVTTSLVSSYSWVGPNGFTSTSQNPNILNATAAMAGTYIVSITPPNSTCVLNAGVTVVINPTPTANSIANQTLCAGSTTTPIGFSSSTSGTSFNWTNSNTAIGLGASGTGNIPSFVTTNASGTAITATITVTPSTASCTGAPITFTITVNPFSIVSSTSADTICSGGTVNIPLTSSVPSTFTWIAGNNPNTTGESITLQSTSTINNTITNTSLTVQTVAYTVTPTAASGSCVGQTQTVNVVVNPFPITTSASTVTICSGDSVNLALVSDTPPSTFTWIATDNTNVTGESTTIQNTGTITDVLINSSLTAQTVVYNVVPTATLGGCAGNTQTVSVIVNPFPNTTSSSSVTICSGDAVNLALVSDTPPSAFTWVATDNTNTSGESTSIQTTSTITDVITNNTNVPQTVLYDVVPTANIGGCLGNTQTVSVTINPTPLVDAQVNDTVCNDGATPAITFTGAVSGTTYSWTNNNTSIGLGANGIGDIPSFTAINLGSGPVTATITVTPSANNCTGSPMTFTITVNPTPNVNFIPDQILCNGQVTTGVVFTGLVTGSTFSWINSTPFIGLAGSGVGNIPSFTVTNPLNATVIATIIVTPSSNGCTGTLLGFNIIVNPTPAIDSTITDQVVCNGDNTAPVVITGGVTGTSFDWTNDTPSIGLAASGTGDINSFTAINTGTAPVIATIVISPTANNCSGLAYTFTITVNPTPTVDAEANQTLCNGDATTTVVFTSPVSGTVFDWTNSDPSIGLAATGTGDINSFTATNNGSAPVTATITITPVANNCTGIQNSFTITVNPTPVVDSISIPNQTLCNGYNTAAVVFTGDVSGTLFTWTNNNTGIGLGAGGTGTIPSFGAINTSSSPDTATVTVTPSANGCTGLSESFTIIVNPTADVINAPNQTVCNGDSTNAATFVSAVLGATFSWVNNDPSIGLPASGNGDIAAFQGINNGTAPVTATITVTPTASGCGGIPIVFTVTVNPTPVTDSVTSQEVCNNATTAAIVFSGAVSGSSFSWTNDTPSIGLSAVGSGNIPSFTATNTTDSSITATITVTPSANSCTGNGTTFTITVDPTPITDAVAGQTLCNGDTTALVTFTSNTPGTTFGWTNSNPLIGLPASGTGDINPFQAINNGTIAITAIITVTPTANGCTGTTSSFTFTINPTPTADSVTAQVLCSGSSTSAINFTSPETGTTYTWTNDTPSIGLAASGSGNIPSFTAINTTANPVTATITVTPSANGCVGIPSTFTITVNNNPVSNAGPVENIDCNGMVTLDGSGSDAGSNITYNWTTLGGNIITGGTTTAPIVNQFGVYTLTVTNTTTGCVSTDTTSVGGFYPPLASFSTTPDPAVGFVPLTVDFTNTTVGGNQFSWDFGDGSPLFYGFDTTHTYNSSGTFTVILTVSINGLCPDTAEVTVVVYEDYSLVIPNIFTPNDDGTNDIWTILSTGVTELDCEIYDRWGLKLFEWHKVDGGWDGHTRAGTRSPDGTYYYMIQLKDIHNEDHKEKGSFMLTR